MAVPDFTIKHQVELSMNTITVSGLSFSYFCERYSLTVSICLFKRQLKQLAEKKNMMIINVGSKISTVFKI